MKSMNIEWNKVTWYSKILALILFVALPFIGFWYGMQYGELVAPLNVAPGAGMGGTDYYHNVAAWQTDQNNAGWSIAYPIDFDANDIYSKTPSMDWRIGADANQPGVLAFTLTIPRAFEPQTNFADAKLTVGYSADKNAVASCLSPLPSAQPRNAVPSATINGVTFAVFQTADAGAGNFYETTSYQALHAGKCWAVQYTIHSSQIANYPAEYGLQPFDKAKLTDILDRIVGTFRFE